MNKNNQLITVEDCCNYYHIELNFIDELNDSGLVEITQTEGQSYIPEDQLAQLEKFIRLHYDLNINTEGIDVIHQLMLRMQDMEREIRELHNRLSIYH